MQAILTATIFVLVVLIVFVVWRSMYESGGFYELQGDYDPQGYYDLQGDYDLQGLGGYSGGFYNIDAAYMVPQYYYDDIALRYPKFWAGRLGYSRPWATSSGRRSHSRPRGGGGGRGRGGRGGRGGGGRGRR